MAARGVCAAAVLICAGVASFGADVLLPGTPNLYATWHAIGIEIPYGGDDDLDATASFTWRRPGEPQWRNGVELTRDAAQRFWWGSVFPLLADERVEIRIAFDDPDGARQEPLVLGAATRAMVAAPAGGRQVRVSPGGQGAISRAARGLRAGDVVQVAPGLYRESVRLGPEVRGEPGRPIFLIGEGQTKPVIDASIEIDKGAAWSDEGAGVFSRPVERQVTLVTQDGRRMYGYTSRGELDADASQAGRAFYCERSRIFLKTGTGKPPGEYVYRVASEANGFHLDGCSHVVVRNFDVRHTSGPAFLITGGGDGNAIVGNAVLNCGMAVRVVDAQCDDAAIWDNTFVMRGQTDFSWRAGMNEHWSFPRDAIVAWTGRGTSIVRNRIDGYHNLIALEPPPGGPRETASAGIVGNRDLDVMYNELLNSSDDAIEADYGGVNMRIFGNRVRNANSGVSVAPCVRGPVYVLRNEFTFRTLMFKFGIGGGTSHGACYCDHNSGYGLTANSSMGIYFNKDLPTTRKYFRNNILVLPETDAALAMRPGNVLDGNCYWRPGGKTPVKFQWHNAWLHGIDAFRSASGMEKHGLIADPTFLATPGLAGCTVSDYTESCAARAGIVTRTDESDFGLRPGSPCIDRGILIRGTNEDFEGRAPDIGAVEFGRARQLSCGPEDGVVRVTRRPEPVPKKPAAPPAAGEESVPGASKATAEKRYAELRRAVIEGVQSGRRERVFVEVGGMPARATLVSADESTFVVSVMGVDVAMRWSDLPPARFYRFARSYTDDHDALYEYCVGSGLTKEAEEEAARR